MNEEVGLIDQTSFQPLFDGAQFIKIKINEGANVMSHPLEDGSKRTDHVVINLVEIELNCILPIDTKALYNSIKEYFLKSTFIAVQTRTALYKNMIISSMPHDEDAEMFSSVGMGIKLTEVKVVTAKIGKAPKISSAKSKKNSPNKDTGKKQPTTAKDETKKQSVLASAADYIKGK